MIMGGQLDGLLSHWQPAFANKLMMMMKPANGHVIVMGRKLSAVNHNFVADLVLELEVETNSDWSGWYSRRG